MARLIVKWGGHPFGTAAPRLYRATIERWLPFNMQGGDDVVVFVCSPYGGKQANIDRAVGYCLMELALGNTPFAPHAFFTQMLNEASDRDLGIQHGLEILSRCDELHAWGRPTEGMKIEIEYAEAAGIPVRWMGGGDDQGYCQAIP